jgi:hypothetical protein
MTAADNYDTDVYAWTLQNAALLRAGRLGEIDALNIAEELESMGKSIRHAVRSRLAVLMAHLLKWRHQAEKRSRSWQNTIRVQRLDIAELLADNPSLKSMPAATLDQSYAKARLLAAADTGLDESRFPEHCPFTVEQVLSDDYWPE